MTRKQALQILIRAATNDIGGQGRGYRSTTDEWRDKVKEAIEKIWKDTYGFEMSDSDRFNLL